MKMSEERTNLVYNAIADPVVELRLLIQEHGSPSSDELDARLFSLTQEVWRKVHAALDLEGQA